MSEETTEYDTGPTAASDAEAWRDVFRRIAALVAEQESRSHLRLFTLSVYRKWPEDDAEITGNLQIKED